MCKVLLLSIVVSWASVGCNDRHEPLKPFPDDFSQLKKLYNQYLSEAELLRDPVNGWLTPHDCDGMIWTGKYAASRNVFGVDIEAAEFKDQPGRFRRKPTRCWDEIDMGAKTTWSRDMAFGLFTYAYKKQRLDLLQRHAEFGVDHYWVMGEPVGELRVFYTPAVVGSLYQLIYALGGQDDHKRSWPNVYPPGLDDYEAHLQVWSIWLRLSATGSVSGTMRDRVEEHAEREPFNPFYQYVQGLFTGDMSEAIKLLLDPSEPVGTYVRCGDDIRRCVLAERIFTASSVIDWMENKQLEEY